MSHFAWILLLMSTGPVYAQNDGDRTTIGEERRLTETVKKEEEQEPAFARPAAQPPVAADEDAERPDRPRSAPQSDRL